MASNSKEEAVPAVADQNAALQKCISLFKGAKNDNERFASLLLVTRLVKSENIDGAQRRLLFNSIGFTFINRLLNTKYVPEDCSGDVYQSLAIAILACFATDEELLLHPQMVAKISSFNQIVSNPSVEKPVKDDVYQILIHFSSTVRGCELLLKKETVLCLCEVISQDSYTPDMAWKVLLNMAMLLSEEMWIKHPEELIKLLSTSVKKMRAIQDMSKFTICANILALLSSAEPEAFKEALKFLDNEQWIVDLCVGLREILQGKVTSNQRDPALILISVVTDLLGIGLKWVLNNDIGIQSKAGLFALIVTSVSIEIRMILDDSVSTTEEIVQKSSLLMASYNIIENIIAYLITVSDAQEDDQSLVKEDCKLEQGMISKLYSQVTEAMSSVLTFLQQAAVKYETQDISVEEKNLVIALVRILCAWLAEESMALQKEVNKVLPFLIRLAKDTMDSEDQQGVSNKAVKTVTFQEPMETNAFPENHPIEMIQFMLPALCHFSAQEESRKILIDNHMHHIIVKYYSILWKRCLEDTPTSRNSKTSLVTLLGVLLNFSVTEPKLVEEDPSFCELKTHVMVNLPKMLQTSENVIVIAHMVVLGLMLIRYHKGEESSLNAELQQFFNSAVNFLKEANKLSLSAVSPSPLSIACQSDWKTIGELWFLGVQVLTACVEKFQGLGKLVEDSGWLNDIGHVCGGHLNQAEGIDKDSFDSLLELKGVVIAASKK